MTLSNYALKYFPNGCNLCKGKVVLISEVFIYGKKYSSTKPYVYQCTKCKAYVGIHKPDYKDYAPLGLLSDKQTKALRIKVHNLFDPLWKEGKITQITNKSGKNLRKKSYNFLAKKMNLNTSQCHIGQFSKEQCLQAIKILTNL